VDINLNGSPPLKLTSTQVAVLSWRYVADRDAEAAEAQPKKVQLSLPSFFKELKPNRTALLETALLTKYDLEKFVYLLLNYFCQDV